MCPLHGDRHPSLRINVEKQLWYCDPCGIGGDAIEFIKLVEGVDFKGALEVLGMGASRPRRLRHTPQHRAAETIVSWVKDQTARMNARIRDLDEMIELADEIPDAELAESLWRERRILADLAEDITQIKSRGFLEAEGLVEMITGTRNGCER